MGQKQSCALSGWESEQLMAFGQQEMSLPQEPPGPRVSDSGSLPKVASQV